jgi:hypothetical protein
VTEVDGVSMALRAVSMPDGKQGVKSNGEVYAQDALTDDRPKSAVAPLRDR